LQQLGWNENLAPLWRRLLQKLAPRLFPKPLPSPHQLYDKLISLFSEADASEAYDPPRQIVLLFKDSQTSLIELFGQQSRLNSKEPLSLETGSIEPVDSISDTLWKVCLDPSIAFIPQEQFQIQQQQFSLKLVHVCHDTPHGKHVVVYRKDEERWLCCNDDQVSERESLPFQNIYAVVYESHPLPKHS
jgi:hypothetical protein